jgi:hypothetical protein
MDFFRRIRRFLLGALAILLIAGMAGEGGNGFFRFHLAGGASVEKKENQSG